MAGLTLLLVEDDDTDARTIEDGLMERGHSVQRSSTAPGTTDPGRLAMFDVIILDRRLAESDGVDHMRGWRAAGMDVPVLILSALGTVAARIEGLEAGADDYLVKPFDAGELDVRLRAIARRRSQGSDSATVLTCGSIRVDRMRRETFREGRRINLQPREQKLLEELALRPGETVSRQSLLQSVWNLSFDPRTKLIETHVSRLRDKLNSGFAGDAIETVRGCGYRLRCDI